MAQPAAANATMLAKARMHGGDRGSIGRPRRVRCVCLVEASLAEEGGDKLGTQALYLLYDAAAREAVLAPSVEGPE